MADLSRFRFKLTFLIPPLFIFSTVSFLLFLAGGIYQYGEAAAGAVLACLRFSSLFLFIYTLLLLVLSLFRRITYIAALLPKRRRIYIFVCCIGALYAVLSAVIFGLHKGT
ncbi:MAG: hypothetical protein LBD20_00790 [Spirochaetaceae bacterium]|jgi:hypothetical protein|nr:hypothetical protein [Spirochaetaceae bacterium]